MVSLAFPFVLIIVCTVLATINRNVPSGYNETRLVGELKLQINIRHYHQFCSQLYSTQLTSLIFQCNRAWCKICIFFMAL